LIEHGENLPRARADAQILGQIYPADRPGRIDQEFTGAGNVAAVWAAIMVQEVVALDGIKFFVGKKCVGVALLLT